MKSFDDMTHHQLSEQLVQVLSNKTQSDNPLFFRVLVAYYLGKVAGTMRPMIQTLDRGTIPINIYAINLAPSGFSKGYSTNIIENQVIHKFKQTFLDDTFPIVGEYSLNKLALDRARKKNSDPDQEREEINKEFGQLGKFLFSFSEGTSPAVKQMRQKLLMSNCGAVNLEMDEIGSNLIANTDVLNTFLELYDVGRVKQKLIKNTVDNVRSAEIDGITPTNMMLFGTPDKLLDGGKTEEEFYSFLSVGYARRCLYGFIKSATNSIESLDAKTILKMRTDKTNEVTLNDIADKLEKLAQPHNHGKNIIVSEPVTLEIIEYERICASRVKAMPERNNIQRAEMTHRYFKALKIAGAYAFIDNSPDITQDHLESAIKLVEESGAALQELLKRDKPHVKLAKYLADADTDVTHADLVEDLPTFKGSASTKADQIALATAWGYKNNVVVKKHFVEGIEFLSAESLKETNMDELIISISDDVAYGYQNNIVTWDELEELGTVPDMHWCAHHLSRGHRSDTNIIEGFNLAVIDVDGGISLDTAKFLLKGYKCLIYTTKRHQTENQDRFRIIFPMNYILNLNSEDYKEFMHNLYDWLPFDIDSSTSDRARKWMTNEGQVEYLDGQLIDIVPFIPKTSKAEEQKNKVMSMKDLTNLERWFVQKTGKGNRSNQLLKYALMLVDTGQDFDFIQNAILALNDKLPNKLDQSEIFATIMRTVGSKLSKR